MKCLIRKCKKIVHAKGLCNRHYIQIRTKGKIFGNPERSNRGENDYKIKGSICIMDLLNLQGEKIAETIFDVEDLKRVSKLKWGLSVQGYAVHDGGRVSLASFILGIRGNRNRVPDHKNRNKLDNRKKNLRVANKSLNALNSKIRCDNTSGYRGVQWDKSKNMWAGYYKGTFLGRSKSKINVINMRKQAELGDSV